MNSTKIKHVHFIAIIGQPNSGKSSLVGDISQQKTDVSPEANFNQHENFNFYQININPVVDAVSKTYLVDVGGLKFKRASNDLERAEQLLTYLINFPTKIEDSFAKTFQIEKIDQCTYAYVVLSSNGNISTETLTIINHLERNSAVWFYVNSRFDERMKNSDSENQKIKGTHMNDIYECFSNYRVEFLNQRCFFISIKEEERNKKYNDLAKLKVALNKSIHEVITSTNSISSSANINITITGAGNIGKSSLVNFLIGKNAKVYATVGEGQQTSKTKPYDLPECPIIKIIDNPGYFLFQFKKKTIGYYIF
jgi:GTP-binding protein EngB required for normal cell division